MLEPHIEIVTQIDRLFEAIFEGRVEDAEQFLNSPKKLTGEELLSANSAKFFSREEEDIGTKPVIREAIIFGLTEYLRRILKAGFDANTSWGSQTALMIAASYGRADIARLFLFHGANPSYETDRYSTVDYCASQRVAEVIASYREGGASKFPPIELTGPKIKDYVPPPIPLLHDRVWQKQQMAPKEKPVAVALSIRQAVVLCAGTVLISVFASGWYALFFERGGFPSTVPIYGVCYAALILTLSYWTLPRGCSRQLIIMLWIIFTISPIIGGHALAYQNLKSNAYQEVIHDQQNRYPDEWKTLDKDQVFRHWLADFTGSDTAVWRGYLQFQTTTGWQGFEGARIYKTYMVIKGNWVWISWFYHFLMLALASALGIYGRYIIVNERL